ncbi:MAG: LPS export ABC transporter ATP-binding protein [Bacteroidia bacterium]|nr:LPS export ABC transporter ATP-binding protein [Bacteroidia bacterium]
MENAIKVNYLDKRFGSKQILRALNFSVPPDSITGFLGPNGAGKTTSFYMITGLIKPNAGRIFLDNEEITDLPMYKRAQKGLGYLAQEASVFRKLSVEDNIMSVMEMSGMSRGQRKDRLEQLLDEFSLHKVRKNLGVQLSGGERRRCEIARALAIDPKFILLDEPFAGVDPIAVEDIQHIIAKLKTKNIGIIITDHNVHETLAITDRAYLLYEGSILESGTAETLANNPEVRRKYLGQNFELRKAILKNKENKPESPTPETKNTGAKNSGTEMDDYLKKAADLEKGG